MDSRMSHFDTPLTEDERLGLLDWGLPALALAHHTMYAAPDTAPPEGWEIFAGLDNDEVKARVYKRTVRGTPQYAVAFRGTHVTDKNALHSDLDIVKRDIPRQYAPALAFVQDLCDTHGIKPSDMLFTGHSLGGYIGRLICTTLGRGHVVTFNAPGPTEKIRNDLLTQSGAREPGERLLQFRSTSDIVSTWGYREGVILSFPTNKSHSLSSLGASMTATHKGEPLPTEENETGALSALFNTAGKTIATHPIAQGVIGKLVNNDPDGRKKFPNPFKR